VQAVAVNALAVNASGQDWIGKAERLTHPCVCSGVAGLRLQPPLSLSIRLYIDTDIET